MKFFENLLLILLMILNKKLAAGFKAAVFEHAQQSYRSTGKPEDIVRSNLEYYKAAASLAKSKGVEIIVFPEYGIIPDIGNRQKIREYLEYIPDPRTTISNPCKELEKFLDRPILYILSCLARENNMILVANMGDVQPCEGEKKCPKDGEFHFNTNVAFGRDGTILAKYHKEHLFFESGMDPSPYQQDPTFETDLGNFAMFVCFDIVFKRITEVAHWKNMTAVLLPTMWLNSSPSFGSSQYFESWAFGNNVTLLAANGHLPGLSCLGSGIMKGRDGAQVYTFNPDGNSKLLISDISSADPDPSIYIVQKNSTKEWSDDGKDVGSVCSSKILPPFKNIYKDYRCLERDTTNFTLAKLNKTSDRIALCHNSMCCMLDYSKNAAREDFYLGVYNGTFNARNHYFFEEENCFLGRCDEFKNNKCVTFPMRSKTLFYKVYLKANFSTEFVYPSVTESGMRLTPVNQWIFESNNKTSSITFKNSSGKKLLMVGLKARAYERDPPYVR